MYFYRGIADLKMFSINFRNKIYTPTDLLNEITEDDLSDYEQKVVLFCREWITGRQQFILHTSGSTGTPKPITILRKYLQASAAMTQQALGLKAGDSSLICLNTQYIAGIMMLVRGMEIGMRMTVIPPDSLPLANFPEDIAFDFLSFVPLQIQEMLTKIPEKIPVLNRAKAIILGGAGISEILEMALEKVKAPVWHTYGMTETVSHIALRRLNGTEKTDFFIALEGVKIRANADNCLVIHTPTAEKEIVTNDVVDILSESTFKFLGRIDNVINSGGVKVQAEKIEKAIGGVFNDYQIVTRFFVGGLANKKFGESVTLFVEYPLKISLEQIRESLLEQGISKYELPVRLEITGKFDETPTGKIERKKMIEKLDFYIWEAKQEDTKILAEISRKTFYETFRNSNNPDDLEEYMSSAFAENVIKAEILNPEGTFFLAYQSGKIAGYLKIRKQNSYLPDENALELQRLYVLSDFQGKQIGQKLMDYCINIAKEMQYQWLWLGVWEHNARAISFYKKNGFEQFSSHSFMLGRDNQTDLLMKKQLC
jgi:O-succinylbenzoic acid--CoA ligase